MVTTFKLVAAVLLWAALYALTPTYGSLVIDGLIPIMLAAAAIAIVFWIPLPKNRRC